MTLLLVEDDDRVAHGLVRLGMLLGHEVLHASSADAGRHLLEANEVDVILADHGLGAGETGLELLAWARDHRPRARRVLVSGAREPAHAGEAAQQFFHKPFGRRELEAILQPVPASA